MLIERKESKISWSAVDQLENVTIAYDGRKEDEEFDTRYKVTQEFMNELNEWKQANFNDDFMFLNGDTIADFSVVINNWWYSSLNYRERNNRLIAIIQWLNGEDVFKIEKLHKFVVRSNQIGGDGDYRYVLIEEGVSDIEYDVESATKFDTREEAQEWANSHQVVVEIDEKGNEVE